MDLLYSIIARLFDRPQDVLKAADEIKQLAAELPELGLFLEGISGVDVEEHRVAMFELAPRCPPYAGYYALGEDNRERGLYMHQILTYYRAAGWDMDVRKELPDYLPAMLEYLAVINDDRLRAEFFRRFIKPWFHKFRQCLEKQGSPYRHLAAALERLFQAEGWL